VQTIGPLLLLLPHCPHGMPNLQLLQLNCSIGHAHFIFFFFLSSPTPHCTHRTHGIMHVHTRLFKLGQIS
jgi:hypothetical protein